MANQACLDLSVKILKVFAYLFTFAIVLGGGVISKGCVLFMTAQLRQNRKLPYCNRDLVSTKDEKKRSKVNIYPILYNQIGWYRFFSFFFIVFGNVLRN